MQLHYNDQPYDPDPDGTYTTFIQHVTSDLDNDLGRIDHQDEPTTQLDNSPQGIHDTIELFRLANPDINLHWRA